MSLLLRICFYFVMKDISRSLSHGNQADIIEASSSTSRYLDDLLNVENIYFEHMLDQIYPAELQLNKTYSSDTEAPFFGVEFINI